MRKLVEMQSKTHTIKTITDLLVLLKRLQLSGPDVVFRGQSQDWPLIPEIGREPFLVQGRDHYDHWIDYEDDLLNRFRKYSHPFISLETRSDWEWLFIARHYGLPTRLLDCSSNPLKALFFSVHNWRFPGKDSVLWAIQTSGWMESIENRERRTLKDVVLVYPNHIDQRIIAQDACFLVFPLPKTHGVFTSVDQNRLVHRTELIVVPAAARDNLRRELVDLGFTHRSIFPGLEGIATSIRQEFGEGSIREE